MTRTALLALLLAACTERVELLGLDDASDPARDAGCGADGCARASCASAGERCAAPADCCSERCEGGFCARSEGCAVVGESCGASADCCSGACATDERGRVVCHGLGGCAPAGEICRADAECCDAASGPGACELFAGGDVGRCRASTRCAQSGELCGDGRLGCCPDGPMSEGLCRPAVGGAILRCVGEAARAMCLPVSARCAVPSECCSGVCANGTTADLTCAATCVAEGRRCTRDADCCAGACEVGVCRPLASECTAFGGPCTASSRCCSGLCSDVSGTCISPLE